MPRASSPIDEATYNQIVSLIHPSEPTVQEIAILPAASHPSIQYDHTSTPPAIGIPKPLLLAAFLHARVIFFADKEDIVTVSPFNPSDLKPCLRVYHATSIILLWEAGHLTAANWRKRFLLCLHQATPPLEREYGLNSLHENARKRDDRYNSRFKRQLEAEFAFVSTMLTSPLTAHAKNSNLWAHRLWLVREFFASSDDRSGPSFWIAELKELVMMAGERHARNYYAWEYARSLWRWLHSQEGGGDMLITRVDKNVERGPSAMHRWCLRHPRDISGWCFLLFMMRVAYRGQEWSIGETRRFVDAIREWAQQMKWNGESVEWVLKASKELLGKEMIPKDS